MLDFWIKWYPSTRKSKRQSMYHCLPICQSTTYIPLSHGSMQVQASAMFVGFKPSMQSLHVLCPASLVYERSLTSVQETHARCPGVPLYLPATHCLHVLAAGTSEKFPAPHGVHAYLSFGVFENLPCSHEAQPLVAKLRLGGGAVGRGVGVACNVAISIHTRKVFDLH